MLTKQELTRYSRHILLPEVRRSGQERLKTARVFVVGAGGLGSPVLLYLAAAGVGHIAFVDNDSLDLTNLQRQILYTTDQVGQAKAIAAAERLRALNPHCSITGVVERLSAANIETFIKPGDGPPVDLVIETSDNFGTKFLVNDACVLAGVPVILGGILRFEGQLMAVSPGTSACYRCLFGAPPPAGSVPGCSEAGVLGAMAGTIGSLQAAEALKILTGAGEPLFGKMMVFDLLTSRFRTLTLPRNVTCPVCGPRPAIKSLRDGVYDVAEYCEPEK